MPRQNRVTPVGEIVATSARGGWMGNRGGRIHAEGALHPTRRWASRRWIICRLDFKGRQRTIMGDSYTELFFLDEATALAAGHRPCYECRRRDALAYATALDRAAPPMADAIDAILHEQRLGPHAHLPASALPDGTLCRHEDACWLIAHGALHRWSHHGYGEAIPLPVDSVEVLTPALTRRALANGYRPQIHASSDSSKYSGGPGAEPPA